MHCLTVLGDGRLKAGCRQGRTPSKSSARSFLPVRAAHGSRLPWVVVTSLPSLSPSGRGLLLSCLSLRRALVIGLRAHPDKSRMFLFLDPFNVVTSVKTPFPNEASPRSQGLGSLGTTVQPPVVFIMCLNGAKQGVRQGTKSFL